MYKKTNIQDRIFKAKIIERKNIAKDTIEYTFLLHTHMDFVPGEYIWVQIPKLAIFKDTNTSDRRAFSISSIPNQENKVSIILRQTNSEFNKTLLELKENDELNIIGPFGSSFCLPSDLNQPIFLIAGGTGLSPFLSLLRFEKSIQSKRRIKLFVVNSFQDRLFYKEEIEKSYSDLDFSFNFFCPRIEEKDFATEEIKDSLVYISGPQDFVNYVYGILKNKNVFFDQFRFESFYPEALLSSKIKDLFIEGKPNINQEEDDFVKERTYLLYELANSSSSHIVITDLEGRIVFANESAQKITGYSFEEMKNNTPRLWGGMMSKEFYKKLWEMKLKGEPFDTEVVNRRKDGRIYFASSHISAIKDLNGQIIGFLGVEEDITSIKESENRAKENEEKFIELTEKIPEIYWITELNPEKVVYISPAFEDIWGVSRENLYENPRLWVDHIHQDDQKKVHDAFTLFMEGKGEYNIDYRVLGKDGETFIIQDKGERVLDENGKLVRLVGVARNVTKEKMIDKEKTEFVSLASHQLKTPIGSINWDLEMLLAGDYGEITPKQKEVMQSMYTMTFRMRELVDNLLKVSRIDMGLLIIEPIPYDLIKLCEEVLMELESYLVTKKHTIIKDFQKDLPTVAIDPSLMLIIMQNYLTNAIKYTKEGGRITVSLKFNEKDLIFSVANNGDPIPDNDQARIFQKMFRAGNAEQQDPDGNGLGLYIVKEIADTAGGRAWFTSKKGEDTVFSISFPLTGMLKKAGTKTLS